MASALTLLPWLIMATPAGAASRAHHHERAMALARGRGSEWRMYGRGHANARHNHADTLITHSSVRRLTPVWSKNGLVGVAGTPAVADGVTYFADLTGTAQAACGPSIVGPDVLWGYGFTFTGGPGPGGVIDFRLPARR